MTQDFKQRSADVRREAASILWSFRSRRAARRVVGGTDARGASGSAAGGEPRAALPVSPETKDLIAAAHATRRPSVAEPSGVGDVAAGQARAPSPHVAVVDEDAEMSASAAALAPASDGTEGAPLAARKARSAVRPGPAAAAGLASARETASSLVRSVADAGAQAEGSNTLTATGDDAKDATPTEAADIGTVDPDQRNEPSRSNAALLIDGLMPHDPSHAAEGTVGDAAVAPPYPQDDPSAAMDAGATDLGSLPGVGTGLIWLLGRCGIASLDDLARADPTVLGEQLGLVGQLLDLQSWIELARDTARADPARTGDAQPSRREEQQ